MSIYDGIVWRFNPDGIGLGIDGVPSARTSDAGMLILQTISYLTHGNLVRLGEYEDEAQWVELWNYPAGPAGDPPGDGFKWPGTGGPLSDGYLEISKLEALPNDVLKVISKTEEEFIARNPGIQFMLAAMACRGNGAYISYYEEDGEIVSLDGGL